jgi:hypothetical protein
MDLIEGALAGKFFLCANAKDLAAPWGQGALP